MNSTILAAAGTPTRRLVLSQDPETGHTDLGVKVRNGMATTAITRLITQLTQLGGTVVLARLLTPADYGVVAIVTVLAGFASIFTDLGIGGAIVQKRDLSQSDLATAFWLNLATGVVLSVAFSVAAWPISQIYHQPQLVPLFIVTSLAFTLSASTVHLAVLERGLHYLLIGTIETFAALCALGVGVTLAFLGAGPMSLSVMFVSSVAMRTLISWVVVGGVPEGRASRASLTSIVRFGRGLVGFNVLNYFSANVDNLVISRVSGLSPLAFYSRAYNLMLLPIYQVQQVMGRVLFPALSALQTDLPRMRNAMERALPLLVAAGAPVSIGMAASAQSLVHVLYGTKWDAVAPLLSIMSLAGPPLILGGALSAGLQALGMTGVQFRRGVVTTIGTVIAVSVGIHWGPRGVAIALAIRAYVSLPINYLPCARILGLQTFKILRDAAAPVIAAVLMGIAVVSLRATGDNWMTLLAQVATGAILYPVLLKLVAPATFADMLRTVRRKSGPA